MRDKIIEIIQGNKIIVKIHNPWKDKIESMENRLFELTKSEVSAFELIDIIVFLFEYKRCKNIHEIINKRQSNSEVFYNINWYLKNDIDKIYQPFDPNDLPF